MRRRNLAAAALCVTLSACAGGPVVIGDPGPPPGECSELRYRVPADAVLVQG